jgi:hypothetical protein
MAKLWDNVDWRTFGGLLALVVVATLLWNTWIVYPLKILVVFFHELSHGLAAVVTGGSIVRIEVVAQEGGLCLTRGGSRFITLSAGYLGSLVWGGIILVIAARTRLDKVLSVLLGVILLVVTLFYVRPFAGFGFIFGLLSALALGALGLWLSEEINDFVLKLVGLTSCLYAVLDIKSDILDRPEVRSDAAMLGELTHIPTVVWGVIWIALRPRRARPRRSSRPRRRRPPRRDCPPASPRRGHHPQRVWG